jgi:TRAP-type C4-dicarboxylate transport system permease small subunit
MHLYVVLFVGIVALAFFAIYFSTVIQYAQEAFNPYLTTTSWVDEEHFNIFYLAATLLTNLWTYVFVFIFFGLVYYAYLYTQRRGVG